MADRCSWNASSPTLACQNEPVQVLGQYTFCAEHAIDRFTVRHLDTWLDRHVNGDTCRLAVKAAMLAVYLDDPEYWSAQAWTNLYDRAKCERIEALYR